MTSEEFWGSPIAVPKPPIRNRLDRKSKSEPLPEPIETREEERDGRTYKVTVLPGFTGRVASLPARPTIVGNYEVDNDGKTHLFRPTGTESY